MSCVTRIMAVAQKRIKRWTTVCFLTITSDQLNIGIQNRFLQKVVFVRLKKCQVLQHVYLVKKI